VSRCDPVVDRVIRFTNSVIIVGTDRRKPLLDLWQKVMCQRR
jgi:hypothetical protein